MSVKPQIMGIVNVTPDSFSDGGVHYDSGMAIQSALQMVRDGADILDIGGESTRPNADFIPADIEISRVLPVIEGIRAAGCKATISIDTRKAEVARAAHAAGADIFNDVSALSFDEDSLNVAVETGMRVCLMHAQGDPKTMQDNPEYDDVVEDIYTYLQGRIEVAVAAGIPKNRIMCDPGIGFGKTLQHNIELIRNLGRFNDLGCDLLLGVSRKRFIGTLSDTPEAKDRVSGSLAAGLACIKNGAAVLRVHDVLATAQALAVWNEIES